MTSVQCIIKQLLDSVFVIRLRLITLAEILIILDITKTSSNNISFAVFAVSSPSPSHVTLSHDKSVHGNVCLGPGGLYIARASLNGENLLHCSVTLPFSVAFNSPVLIYANGGERYYKIIPLEKS